MSPQTQGGTRFNRPITVGAAATSLVSLAVGVMALFNGYALSKGSQVALVGALSLNSAGQQTVQNPLTEELICDDITLRVSTAPSPVTIVKAYTATGLLAISQNPATGTLAHGVMLTAGIHSGSGTELKQTGPFPRKFILAASGSTSNTLKDYVHIVATTGTGQGLSGKYHINCERLQ